jgi:integrase/recombinase XerC
VAEPLAEMQDVRGMTLLEHIVTTSTKKRPSTRAAYQRAIRSFIDHAGSDWSGAAVESWRDALIAKGLSHRTINARLAAVRFASKRLHDLGHAERDAARAVEFLPVMKEKKRFARPIAEAMRLLDACRGRHPADLRDFALFTLGFRAGVRRESLAALKFDDIEGRRFRVVIKGGRIHELVVDDDVIAAMRPWIAFLARRGITTGHVFRSIRPTMGPERVEVGDRLHPASINKIMEGRCQQAGVRFHPHLMRHCVISWLLGAGASVFRVQQLTGHRDPASIQEYAHDVDAERDPVGGLLPPFTTAVTT